MPKIAPDIHSPPSAPAPAASTTADKDSTRLSAQISPSSKNKHTITIIELFLFGMLVLGKAVTYWQSAFVLGFWEFFFSIILLCIAYFCFVSSLSEMTSILPFSGGSYGYARCVLGPFIGYMVGYFEAMEYIMFVTSSLVAFGKIMTLATGSHRKLEPLYWLFFYAVSIPMQIYGGDICWKSAAIFGLFVVVLFLIYILGNAGVAHMDIDKNFAPNANEYLKYFPVAGWGFKGIEVMTLTCAEIPNPSVQVPRAMMGAMTVMILLVISIVLIAGSIAPGSAALVHENLPMNPGLMRIFNIKASTAELVQVPCLVGTSFVFLFAGAHQLYAMASSGLFNPWMKYAWGPNQTPVICIINVAILSFIIGAGLFYGMKDGEDVNVLFTLSMMSSLPVYICLMLTYIIMKLKFSNLERQYISPTGIAGAIYALLMYCFACVTLIGFPDEVTVSTSLFVSTSVAAMVYYFLFASKRQFFSKEEQDKFLKIYVMNANRGKHNKKGHRVVPHGGVTGHPTTNTGTSPTHQGDGNATDTTVRINLMDPIGTLNTLFNWIIQAQLGSLVRSLRSHHDETSHGPQSHAVSGHAVSGHAAAGMTVHAKENEERIPEESK